MAMLCGRTCQGRKNTGNTDFLNDFMAVCRKHQEICEPVRKHSHAVNHRENYNGYKTDFSEMSHSEHHQRFYDKKEKSPVIPSTPKSSLSFQKPVTLVEKRTHLHIDDRKSRSPYQHPFSAGRPSSVPVISKNIILVVVPIIIVLMLLLCIPKTNGEYSGDKFCH